MNTQTYRRVCLWVTVIYAAIVALFVAEVVMLSLAVYVGVYVYYQYLVGMNSLFIFLVLALAVELLRVIFRNAVALYERQGSYQIGLTEPRSLGEMIVELCNKRRVGIPSIVVQPRDPHLWNPAAIFDTLFLKSIVYLDAEIVWTFPRSELQGIVAHELRHHNASTNSIKAVIAVILEIWKRTWFYCVSFAGVWIVLRGLPLFGVGVVAIGMLVGVVFLGLSRTILGLAFRLDEFKTDILAAYDLNQPTSFIHGLERLESVRPGSFAEFLKAPRSTALRMGSFRWWSELYETLQRWVTLPRSTHPSTPARRQLLERVFGPIPDCTNLGLDEELGVPQLYGGVFIIFELPDD